MLKNDTLKNGTSRVGLYGSGPPGSWFNVWFEKTHLTGCIGEIIGFHRRLRDKETSYIHQYLMRKWEITDTIIDV